MPRRCHDTCPVHGHWCDSESPLPHVEHTAQEFCGCRWDNSGDHIPGGLEAQKIQPTFITIELPKGGAVK